MPDLTTDIQDCADGKAKLMRLTGDIDAHTYNQMEKTFLEVLRTNVKYVIADLTGVAYMASRGLGMFLNARKTLSDREGDLILVAPNDAVRGTIAVLGFDSIFTITSTEEEALAAIA